MKNDALKEMKLPFGSSQEDLEELSRDKLRPLFPKQKFQIRDETYRDKGLDLSIELKSDGRYTNFRGMIQLKATESNKKNKDGSFSIQIETSNINYLINSGLQSFYILYLKEEDRFYWVNTSEFWRSLQEKASNWDKQPSHTLRADRVLDEHAFEEIYQTIYNWCLMLRPLKEKTALLLSLSTTEDKVLINKDMEVISDAEIRSYIEREGFFLLNGGEFKTVLELHSKASQAVGASSRYHLAIAIAFYNTSQFLDALTHLKYAHHRESELNEGLRAYLRYFDALTRLNVGILSEEEYKEIIQSLEKEKTLGLYIHIEKAKDNLLLSNLTPEAFSAFEHEIESIVAEADKEKKVSIGLLARIEYLTQLGTQIAIIYSQKICEINAVESNLGVINQLRLDTLNPILKRWGEYDGRSQDLLDNITKSKNLFALHCYAINDAQARYQFFAHASVYQLVKKHTDSLNIQFPYLEEELGLALKRLNEAIAYFEKLGHADNTSAALAIKYEILHFQKRYEEANAIGKLLRQLSEKERLPTAMQKVNSLLHNGTTHELHKQKLDSTLAGIKIQEDKWTQISNECLQLDESERKQIGNNFRYPEPVNSIELFPIGHFQFPDEKIGMLFSIIGVVKQAVKDNLSYMFSIGIVPVVNILYETIEEEGYRNGRLAHQGLKSMEHIYRIRKRLFEEKIYRNQMFV